LCVCTCCPGLIALFARPIACPYRCTISPGPISRSATLCPAGIGSVVTTVWPSTLNSVWAEIGTRATATLSVGWRWMAEFSAVGSLAISSNILDSLKLSQQHGFGNGLAVMDVQAIALRMHPDPGRPGGGRNLCRPVHHGEVRGFDTFQQ